MQCITIKTSSRLAWNEEELKLNEASRTSTMRIDEAKTPYLRYSAEEDKLIDEDALRLQSRASLPQGPTNSSNSSKMIVPFLHKAHPKRKARESAVDGNRQRKGMATLRRIGHCTIDLTAKRLRSGTQSPMKTNK